MLLKEEQCIKSVQIRSYFGSAFLLNSVRIQENADQKELRIWTIFTQWKFYRINKILDFFEHTLILINCMFDLTDVYYINVISIILPLRCFLFKIFLRSSKLWSRKLRSILKCLTKLLPTMTSIWLNYIKVNQSWYKRCKTIQKIIIYFK